MLSNMELRDVLSWLMARLCTNLKLFQYFLKHPRILKRRYSAPNQTGFSNLYFRISSFWSMAKSEMMLGTLLIMRAAVAARKARSKAVAVARQGRSASTAETSSPLRHLERGFVVKDGPNQPGLTSTQTALPLGVSADL